MIDAAHELTPEAQLEYSRCFGISTLQVNALVASGFTIEVEQDMRQKPFERPDARIYIQHRGHTQKHYVTNEVLSLLKIISEGTTGA